VLVLFSYSFKIANFTESQRNATLEAAKIANIQVIRLVAEPTAAAISYLVDTDIKGKDGKYIVFDFGGGTLDVSLVKVRFPKILAVFIYK